MAKTAVAVLEMAEFLAFLSTMESKAEENASEAGLDVNLEGMGGMFIRSYIVPYYLFIVC